MMQVFECRKTALSGIFFMTGSAIERCSHHPLGECFYGRNVLPILRVRRLRLKSSIRIVTQC